MIFIGISRDFDLTGEQQYETIGRFWEEMERIYGAESLRGLGYAWKNNRISYAIGLKDGYIDGYDLELELPESGWTTVSGKTDSLKQIYDEIYKVGALKYEIEAFFEDGSCEIQYYR